VISATVLGLVSGVVNAHPIKNFFRRRHEVGIKRVSVGSGHICAITFDDELRCWGRNGHGQIGDGTTDLQPESQPVELPKVAAVWAQYSFTCAITLEHEPFCWGDNQNGYLGVSIRGDVLKPAPLANLKKIRQFSFGIDAACGVTDEKEVYCWGRDNFAQLGAGPGADHDFPTKVNGLSDIEDVSTGGRSFCARSSEGDYWCWGDNGVGQMGLQDVSIKTSPTRLSSWPKLRHYSNGWGHACGVTLDGRVFCAGLNGHGELGDGTRTTRHKPTAVKGINEEIQWVFTHRAFTCAMSKGGRVYCWGDNHDGQLGTGREEFLITASPVKIPGAVSFESDSGTTCVITSTGGVYCWGNNEFGQLGLGHRRPVAEPVLIALPAPAKQIDVSSGHVCAVLETGALYCWGYSNANWGEGLPRDILAPQRIAIY
jgi:alpha-tubulin suppressor-like RCC1 family protein